MEPYPGVFVSSSSPDAWQTDPDAPDTETFELVHADGVQAGLSRYTGTREPISWTSERREVALILEGSVRIDFDDGSSAELGAGDFFSIAPRVAMTWHITTPFKEAWIAPG
jgi:uncharacterized cupin superfamily protein